MALSSKTWGAQSAVKTAQFIFTKKALEKTALKVGAICCLEDCYPAGVVFLLSKVVGIERQILDGKPTHRLVVNFECEMESSNFSSYEELTRLAQREQIPLPKSIRRRHPHADA